MNPAFLIKIAHKTSHPRFFHVAVVVKGGAIKAVGYNHDFVHAEDMALSKMWPSERAGCKLYSFRVRKDGSFAMAKPCENCMKMIVDSGIKTIYYSNSNGKMEKIKVR